MSETRNDFEKLIYVKDSAVHGKGIFAGIGIPEGELIMAIRGEVISGDECERREEEENNVYIFWNGDTYIDTAETEKIKYINHDCDPNCEVDDNDEESLLLYAARDIKAGEELTIDYGYDEIYDNCNCYSCSSSNFREAVGQ